MFQFDFWFVSGAKDFIYLLREIEFLEIFYEFWSDLAGWGTESHLFFSVFYLSLLKIRSVPLTMKFLKVNIL